MKELLPSIVPSDTLTVIGHGGERWANEIQETLISRVQVSIMNNHKVVVPQEGFEPPTPSLRMMCSTG